MEIDRGLHLGPGVVPLDFEDIIERPKSALRMRYAAEIKVFKAQHGNLEDIRQKLGFSRRKMCQLLMVDPSAWTRWCKDESKVPPHIYRALEWFLALNQKALTQPDLASVFLHKYKGQNQGQAADIQLLQGELQRQSRLIQNQRRVSYLLMASLVCLAAVLSGILIAG